MTRTTATLLAVMALPAGVAASGFSIAEQGARATGVASAVTARATDGSAVFYNPAGITALEGVHAYLGGNLILPASQLTERISDEVTEANARAFVTPTLFLTAQTSDVLTVGIGIYAPYGLGLRWPSGWAGSDMVTEAELTTLFFSPVVATRVAPGLSLAAGVDIVPAAVELLRDVRFGSATGRLHLGGSALGIGGRVGVTWDTSFLEPLSLGLSWRSPVELSFAGAADIDADPVFRADLPPDGHAVTDITLPHTLSFGIAFSATPALALEVDLSWTGWSSYDALTIVLADGSTSTDAKEWRDTLAVRAGVEWTLGIWTLRGGYAFDASPVPNRRLDPTLPDGDRHIASAGLGVRLPAGMAVDAGVLWVLPLSRETGLRPALRGTYEISAWVASMSLAITLGEPPVGAVPPAPPSVRREGLTREPVPPMETLDTASPEPIPDSDGEAP